MSKLFRGTASALRVRGEPGGADTGKRILHGQIVRGVGESWDGEWIAVSAPAGGGWAHSSHLELVQEPEVGPDPDWPVVPHGKLGIIEVFGEPCQPRCATGRVELPEPLPLYRPDAKQFTRSFHCHELMVGVFDSVFRELHRRGYWPLLEDWGGVYNCRLKAGTSQKRSTHAWGIAVDVATQSNPLGRQPTLDPRVVAIFEDAGFLWGGRWSRPDGMHFQYATGY